MRLKSKIDYRVKVTPIIKIKNAWFSLDEVKKFIDNFPDKTSDPVLVASCYQEGIVRLKSNEADLTDDHLFFIESVVYEKGSNWDDFVKEIEKKSLSLKKLLKVSRKGVINTGNELILFFEERQK